MKSPLNRPPIGRSSTTARVSRFALLVLLLFVVSSTAFAVIVQTSTRKLNAGRADFGSGNHSFGSPEGSASITFDWNNGTGQLVSTARVRGTIYWDSLFGGGCARLTINFLNSGGTVINTVTRTECGSGGDANNSDNQTNVDVSFSSINLFNVTLRVAEIQGGQEVSPQSTTVGQTSGKSFGVTIDNGTADFGEGDHHFGHPDNPGFVSFQRNTNATLTGFVDGILYLDTLSTSSPPCVEMDNDFKTSVSHIHTWINCGPGGDANNGANETFISPDSFTSGSLSTIAISVFTRGSNVLPVNKEFGFAGAAGDFNVEPGQSNVKANDVTNYAFTWAVPEPLNWHNLDTLELRVMDGSSPILDVRFREAGNVVSVRNEATGEFGPEFPVGSNARLQTRYATLDLGGTTVGPVTTPLGTGPNSPIVQLVLPLRFKPSAAGKTYLVDVAATDDLGHQDPFAVAGTITVAK